MLRLAVSIVLVLNIGAQATAQVPPASYRHTGSGPAGNDAFALTFAACRLQANISSPVMAGSMQSLANWLSVRDDCMRAQGWVRD